MYVRIWGCRGSYPVSGADFVRYGGNTACVEVWVGETLIIFDAGTGMRPLGQSLCSPHTARSSKDIHLLITHTHWDHIIGLPFFQPLRDAHTTVTVYGLRRSEQSFEATLTDSLGRPLFAMPLNASEAQIRFREVDFYTTFAVGPDVKITTARLNHPYRAVGYRVEGPDGCLAYITDTAPFDLILFGDEQVDWHSKDRTLDPVSKRTLDRIHLGVLDLAAKADWVIYDTQFEPEEYVRRPHWGHSTPNHAILLAKEAQAKSLVLFHHDPHRTDNQIDAIEGTYRSRAADHGVTLIAGREGLTLTKGVN